MPLSPDTLCAFVHEALRPSDCLGQFLPEEPYLVGSAGSRLSTINSYDPARLDHRAATMRPLRTCPRFTSEEEVQPLPGLVETRTLDLCGLPASSVSSLRDSAR